MLDNLRQWPIVDVNDLESGVILDFKTIGEFHLIAATVAVELKDLSTREGGSDCVLIGSGITINVSSITNLLILLLIIFLFLFSVFNSNCR